MTETPENIRLAVGNFQINSQLAGQSGQSCSISGYIYSDDNEVELNGRLDMYKRVIDRQQKLSEIPLLEAHLQAQRDALVQSERLLSEFLDKERQGIKIPSNEKMNGKNLQASIRHLMDKIAEGEAAIEQKKREVA